MIPGESHYNNECNCKNCLQINRLTMTDNLKKDCPYRNPDCPQCHSTNKEKESWCCDGCISTKGIKKNISCDNLYCPCHKEENWEKEFDKIWKDFEDDHVYDYDSKFVTDFIHSLLKSQRAELIEEIEGMKKEDEHSKNCSLVMSPCESCAEEFAYNQAIEDVLTKLKNK